MLFVSLYLVNDTIITIDIHLIHRIRRKTAERLELFTGGEMSNILKLLTFNDLLYPVINEEHFSALERRLLKIFSVIEHCRGKFGENIFQ